MRKSNIIKPSTTILDDEMYERICIGIAQNIQNEMFKRRLSYRDMTELSGLHYAYFTHLFNGDQKIGLKAFISCAMGLNISPTALLPYDLNKRKTQGERFDEITKELDEASKNFLIDLCASYCRENKRIKRTI